MHLLRLLSDFIDMIRTIILALLIFSLSVYGQREQQQGEATYSVSLLKSMRGEYYIALNPSLPIILEKAIFSLKFKQNRAVFDIMNLPHSNQKDLKLAATVIGIENYPFWQDSLAAYTVSSPVKRFGIESYLLISTIENGAFTEWNITDETKEIAGYQCYKATRMDIDIDAKSTNRNNLVVAWFSPDLPFPFGPKNYGGLPGLILELQTQYELFSFTDIKLDTPINIPPLPDLEIKPHNDLSQLLYEKLLGQN